MRRIIPIISLLIFFAGATFGQTTVSIPDTTAPDGAEVLIPVNIGDLDNVGSVNFNIQFDTDVLTYESIENNVLAGATFVVNLNDDILSIGWFSTTPADLSGKIFDIKFSYVSGSSNLAFVGTNEIADNVGSAYPVTFVDGSIGPEPATMSLSTSYGIPDENVIIELDASNLKNIGNMNIYIDYNVAVAEFVGIGAVNLPNFIAAADGGTVSLGMFNTEGFDHVSGVLAELEFKLLSGTDDLTFDQAQSIVEQVDFTPVPIVYSDGRIGEVDPAFVLGDAEGQIGTDVSVPFNGVKLTNIGSFNIEIEFDPAVLEYVGVENVVSGAMTGNVNSPGVLSLGYFDATGLDMNNGKIADIVFTYSGGTSDVAWDETSADIQDLDFNPVTVSFFDGSVSLAPPPPLYEYAEYATDGELDQEWVFNKWAGDAGSNISVADSTGSDWGSHVIVYEDSGYTGLAHVRELALTNYTISADFYLVGDPDPDFNLYTGLSIKLANDEGKYYRMVFRNSSSSAHGQIRLQGYDGASWHISQYWEPGTDFAPITTGWHNFKVKVEGNDFYCYLNDQLLPGSPYTDDDPFLPLGYAGVYKYNTAYGAVVFDNFEVKSPELPPAQKYVSISDIQQGQNASGQYTDQAVRTSGVVSGTGGSSYFVQDGQGAWSGINVYDYGNTVAQGDSVTLTGFVMEYFGKTELVDIVSVETHSTGNDVAFTLLMTGAINDEQYESVLVSTGMMAPAYVTQETDGNGEWALDDGSGPILVDDLMVDWTPLMGEQYVVIGVNDYTWSNFKIQPRDSSEVVRISGPEDVIALEHTPGDLAMGVINNGFIGDDGDGAGPGVNWKGNNGLWNAGVIFGTSARGSVNGILRSFTGLDPNLRNDLANLRSDFASGLFESGNFNEASYALLNDSNAPVPYDVSIEQETYSRDGDNFVFIRYGLTNNTETAMDDVYAGIFADWDIGPGSEYQTNRGGIFTNEHLVYEYGTQNNLYYYGIAAINGLSGGNVTDAYSSLGDGEAIRQSSFEFISTPVTESWEVDADGDHRSWTGSMIGTIEPGATEWVTFAIVAGDDLFGVRDNANAAFAVARDEGWTDIEVSVEDLEGVIPEDFSLSQNYPNPFNPSTTIQYGLPAASQVKITVYNSLGEVIDVLVNRDQAAGYHEVNWNASNLASGIYFYAINANSTEAGKDFAVVRKMMLLK